MRHLKSILIAFPLFMFAFFACTSGDDNSSGNITPAAGQWKITYFFDKQDKSSNYSNYTFEFDSNGSMSATNGSQTWSGTWQTGFDDSADKFLIDFIGTVPSALSELEEDWRIITVNDNLMHFEHTSGGNGDTDVVKFTKI
ncbi:MAG: hypothetical protein IPK76_00910 [Lewinellaceae bacterium]|nr:hypothetical protein [Lewinellaceae bacterium]